MQGAKHRAAVFEPVDELQPIGARRAGSTQWRAHVDYSSLFTCLPSPSPSQLRKGWDHMMLRMLGPCSGQWSWAAVPRTARHVASAPSWLFRCFRMHLLEWTESVSMVHVVPRCQDLDGSVVAALGSASGPLAPSPTPSKALPPLPPCRPPAKKNCALMYHIT